ncbi:MAG: radical SAM family heme chaperone HemW [Verrucomicrobiae bacterium]|nr:radical SAM family heme chaperone HemW [Verrucomicrobiae bacterium]
MHFPFCLAKCHYCAFYSRQGTENEMADYVATLCRDLDNAPPLRLQTLYIGGGTPSILPLPLWQQLLDKLPRPAREWTIECNPATVEAEKAALWRAAGVNRLSLGVQSFDDKLLALLGRVHNAAQAVETFRLLRDAGFDNINLDLMFGLPGQTTLQWRDTLERALALAPEHISAYSLTLEEGTKFWGRVELDEELQWAMYEQLIETLTAAGYHHYEISNFAKPGHECQHNLAYWRGEDYLGLGPSAVSTVGLRRWTVGGEEEHLTEEIKRAERIAFGLRMLDGIPAHYVNGYDISRLLADGLVERHNRRLRLTRRGLRYADTVAAEFV